MAYTLEQIAGASAVPIGTARSWQHRGVVLCDEGKGSGNTTLYSLNHAIQFALTAELARFGIAPRRAAMLAGGFTHMAEPAYMPDTAGETREPGALYANGRTVLIAHVGQDVGRVVRVSADTPAELLFNAPGAGPCTVACMVNVNPIVRRVRDALGVVE